MAHLLHLEMSDGTQEHRPFSKATWELFARKEIPGVLRGWAHPEGDCNDPVKEILGTVKREPAKPTLRSHNTAAPIAAWKPTPWDGPVDFPPPWHQLHWEIAWLSELANLCVDDARRVLLGFTDTPPIENVDLDGQYGLF